MQKAKDGTYNVQLGKFNHVLGDGVVDNLQERAVKGQLYAEFGAPRRDPRVELEVWKDRIMTIDESNVCAQITDVRLDGAGKILYATIKPHGPMAQALLSMAESKEDVVFGMRGFMNPDKPKEIGQIVTYDLISGH